MSIEIVNDQIKKFIANSDCNVMSIQGGWGVGKTFTWNSLLTKYKSTVSFDKYSYVSLFGINSLDSLKYSIFENTINNDLIGTEANIDTFRNNMKSSLKGFGRKGFNLLRVFEQASPAVNSLSFLSVNETLICIDDLERRGAGLEIKDVLGLISLLKEQRGCKVIILLNEGEKGLDEYVKYREKVIDLELIYAPTTEECVQIAFNENDFESITIKKLAKKLDIKNIRILKKIEKLTYMMKPLMNDLEEETKYNALHSLTLFMWCYYSAMADEKIPNLDFILSQPHFHWGHVDEEVDEKVKQWREILSDYDYNVTNELDIVIAESVRAGFIIESNFRRCANIVNGAIIVSKSEHSFTRAWDLFHNNFNTTTDEVINGLSESFRNNVNTISIGDLNGTISLFRELEANEEASKLIDFYIESRRNETDLFNIDETDFFGEKTDEEIYKKFNEFYESTKEQKTAKEVLDNLVADSSWSNQDIVILASTSVDEYYEIFKSINSRQLPQYVKKCLKFTRSGNEGAEMEIYNKSKEALVRISGESKVNRVRIGRYGILDE